MARPVRRFVTIACGVLLFAACALAQPAGFEAWLGADAARPAEVRAFEAYLRDQGVGDVLPADQLLLSATSWKDCGMPTPYTLAPRSLWPHVVPTIRFIRDEIIPAIGPVEVFSAYRAPALNRCAGGAPLSAHAQFYALDLVPQKPMTRAALIETVCALHRKVGQRYGIGLGFYGGLRFHIDTMRYRRWGSDHHAGTSPCNTVRLNAG